MYGFYGNPQAFCPVATKDLALNVKNRQLTIDKYMYGPPNPSQPARWYWEKLASRIWRIPKGRVTEKQLANVKSMRCGNCVAFDVSPRMEQCMPGPVSAAGKLGYCWMHEFKCASLRTCSTWAGGGPIRQDSVSYDWQKRKEK